MKDKFKNLFIEYNFRKFDFWLLLLTIAIGILGVRFVGSADNSYMERQQMGLILGLIFMLVLSFISYSFIIKFYWPIYAFSVFMLVLVRLYGDSGGGAARWFEFGGLRFQPSELVKILLILFYAQFIMKHEENFNTIRVLTLSVVLVLPIFVLIFKQPDLSTSIMVLVIFGSVMFIGGLNLRIILGALLVGVPSLIFAVSYVIRDDIDILDNYQKNRILAWLHPEQYANTE
ncbi:MAG: FtsW/RodA/SpoVE family cell cycle protein, partial [Lachnospiraceae bacterium]|nr:FtsW/RodA/SpoVE family cell cycle protein [Lachnospiraceae bacterium]